MLYMKPYVLINIIDFISVVYARRCHWRCGRTQLWAATINQFACPSRNLFVQLPWYHIYYTLKDEGFGKPCAVDQASYNIGTKDGSRGDRGMHPPTSPNYIHYTVLKLHIHTQILFWSSWIVWNITKLHNMCGSKCEILKWKMQKFSGEG